MITTLAEFLSHAVRKHADSAALAVENCRFSIHELDAPSNRIINGLVALFTMGVARSRN